MKTLVNKNNPAIRIIAPEFKMNEYGRWYTPDETRKTVELTPENWTLIEEKPVDLEKEIREWYGLPDYIDIRTLFDTAKHFYELGRKGGRE